MPYVKLKLVESEYNTPVVLYESLLIGANISKYMHTYTHTSYFFR